MKIVSVKVFVLLLVGITIALVAMAATDGSTAADNWPTPDNVSSWLGHR